MRQLWAKGVWGAIGYKDVWLWLLALWPLVIWLWLLTIMDISYMAIGNCKLVMAMVIDFMDRVGFDLLGFGDRKSFMQV